MSPLVALEQNISSEQLLQQYGIKDKKGETALLISANTVETNILN